MYFSRLNSFLYMLFVVCQFFGIGKHQNVEIYQKSGSGSSGIVIEIRSSIFPTGK